MLGPRNFILIAAAVFGGIAFLADKVTEPQRQREEIFASIEALIPPKPLPAPERRCFPRTISLPDGEVFHWQDCVEPDEQIDA